MERNRETLISNIQRSCDMSRTDAKRELNSELQSAREMLAEGDLNYEDMEDMCMSLGVDFDYIEDMIMML